MRVCWLLLVGREIPQVFCTPFCTICPANGCKGKGMGGPLTHTLPLFWYLFDNISTCSGGFRQSQSATRFQPHMFRLQWPHNHTRAATTVASKITKKVRVHCYKDQVTLIGCPSVRVLLVFKGCIQMSNPVRMRGYSMGCVYFAMAMGSTQLDQAWHIKTHSRRQSFSKPRL